MKTLTLLMASPDYIVDMVHAFLPRNRESFNSVYFATELMGATMSSKVRGRTNRPNTMQPIASIFRAVDTVFLPLIFEAFFVVKSQCLMFGCCCKTDGLSSIPGLGARETKGTVF